MAALDWKLTIDSLIADREVQEFVAVFAITFLLLFALMSVRWLARALLAITAIGLLTLLASYGFHGTVSIVTDFLARIQKLPTAWLIGVATAFKLAFMIYAMRGSRR